jgi:catechol 2,3-dioxygenase-like lactoylglutathione lyase family enzyme
VRPRRVYETVVYASDLESATAFYRGVLGLREVDGWRERLRKAGVELEQEMEWARGGAHSIYVRDQAGNSVELAEGEVWPP